MLPSTNSSSTTLEGPSSPFFHFPWSFLDGVDEELLVSHLLSQHAPVTAAPAGEVYVANGADLPTTTRANMITEGDSIALIPKKRKHGITQPQQKKIQTPGKKTGKKDRHSKICTAQGLRDRRMRLSLKVARKFFDLQDMLGFDKASKTIDWLLINCKDAIQQLSQTAAACNKHISDGGEKSMSFSASEESEVESEAKETEIIRQAGEEEPLVGKACRGKRKQRKSCKVAANAMITSHLARESRDKARERARVRTREKLMMINRKAKTQSTESNPQILKHHHLHAAAEDSGNSSPQADLFEEPQAAVAVMDELLGTTRSSSSSTYSPDFAAALSGPKYNNEFPGFLPIQKSMEEARIEPAAGCYAMTSKKPSQGNVQVQSIPNAMFRTTLNAQRYDKLPSSTFMAISDGGQWNPSSIFAMSPTTLDQENPFPNSFLMTRTSNALEGLFTATSSNASFQSSYFPGNQFP